MVLETWIGIALSITPPCRVWPCGRTCFFAIFRPSTMTLLTCGIARETVPCFPLSLPVIIKTVSPFLIFILARCRGFFSFCFVAIFSSTVYRLSLSHSQNDKHQRKGARYIGPLQYFGRERNDFHKISFAQFAGDRAKDTGAAR